MNFPVNSVYSVLVGDSGGKYFVERNSATKNLVISIAHFTQQDREPYIWRRFCAVENRAC